MDQERNLFLSHFADAQHIAIQSKWRWLPSNRSPEQSDEGSTAKKQVASAEEESKEIHESTMTPQALPEMDGRSHGWVREEGGGTMDSSSQK